MFWHTLLLSDSYENVTLVPITPLFAQKDLTDYKTNEHWIAYINKY